MPDYSADGHRYKSALDTPLEIDGKVRSVDDFQPRKNVKEYLAQGMLKSENDFEHFCGTFACEKILMKKYVQHLQILEINKRKRADIRKIQQQEQESKRYEEYEWAKLFEEGELKKLKVKELDKYLIHHNLPPITTPKKYDDHPYHPNIGSTPPPPGSRRKWRVASVRRCS